MAKQDGLGPPPRPGEPRVRQRSVAAAIGGLTVLAWAAISVPALLAMRTNEAGAIVALSITMTVVPAAALVGAIELLLTWGRALTAWAILGTVAGTIGGVFAVPLLIGSLRDLSAFVSEEGPTYGAERFAAVMSSLGVLSVIQVAIAALLLQGRWRLLPPAALAAGLVVTWGPAMLPPPPAACPSVATLDLPGRLAMVGRGSGRGEYLPPGAICVATPRTGGTALVFAPSADDIAAEREWVNHPAFSPDGRWLAFTWEDGVVVMRDDGSALSHVGPAGAALGQPSWSPDGTTLAVVVDSGAVTTVSVADGRMDPVAAVEEPVNSRSFPRWSPIADDILAGIVVPYPGSEDVVRLALDGSAVHLAAGLQPDWSPDGSRIAFVHRGPQVQGARQEHRVMLMDADGGDIRELGGTPEHQEGPVWSPDGLWIAYAGYDDDWGIYVQPASGGPARRVATGLGSSSIDWAP